MPGAFKACPAAHLGLSDYISLSLIPWQRPLIGRERPLVKTVRKWREEATSVLQDCFHNIDWGLRRICSLSDGVYTLDTENITTQRTIAIFPNQKPWFSKSERTLLRERDDAFRFRSREGQAYRESQTKQKGTKDAKRV